MTPDQRCPRLPAGRCDPLRRSVIAPPLSRSTEPEHDVTPRRPRPALICRTRHGVPAAGDLQDDLADRKHRDSATSRSEPLSKRMGCRPGAPERRQAPECQPMSWPHQNSPLPRCRHEYMPFGAARRWARGVVLSRSSMSCPHQGTSPVIGRRGPCGPNAAAAASPPARGLYRRRTHATASARGTPPITAITASAVPVRPIPPRHATSTRSEAERQ